MLKEEKQTMFVFKRLNWKLVCTHSPVLQNYKTELESTLVLSDPLGNIVVTTGEESGTFLFKWSHPQSQVSPTSLAASESYCIVASASHCDNSLSEVAGPLSSFIVA